MIIEWLADITERFRFVDDSLAYVDAPLEGFLVDVATGARYAFRAREIVANTVWHWVLLPVGAGHATVSDVFTSASADPPARWLSVLEDRREGACKLGLAEMTSERTPPPLD